MLDSGDGVLTTMAGSFGYAAPEVMMKKGHGKAVDMWSLGVIAYTLLCGYSPFRSESLPELIEECSNGRVIFHERYWKEVSKDAKDFIGDLLQPNPEHRPTSQVRFLPIPPRSYIADIDTRQAALNHTWLKGETATDHDVLPEIKSYIAKARLRRGIEVVKLANRIEALKMTEDDYPSDGVPTDSGKAAIESTGEGEAPVTGARKISKAARSAIFKEVVLAKVREMKADEEKTEAQRTMSEKSSRK